MTWPGRPSLELELGVRADAEATALGRAQRLYDRGEVAAAARIFARHQSLEAQLGAALAAWRQDGPDAVQRLAATHPRSALVALNLGWAEYQAGRSADAIRAWRRAERLGADSPYGVDAEDALHSGPPGLPPIVTGLELPKPLAGLPAAAQVAALKRAAAAPDLRAKLLYGATLWNYLRMPISAETQFAAAARLAPHDPLARAAAAVALFSKGSPTRAFARLGPLTAVFPHSSAIEFHLGVLLLYIGENRKAAEHLGAAVSDGPRSPYAKPARTLLASLARTRSK
jgi:tetratricopeptide (TPR) repeat protein